MNAFMPANVTQKLIQSHLLEGAMTPGTEIGVRIDQTLTQDATGTLVMLELEAMGVRRVQAEVSVQYVDHNLIQEDYKNADDHAFLESACRKFGVWYSRPGNGVSHPVHQQRFGKPGKTLVGSDSHTPAAGALGMLALGAGGLEVALAMIGKPLYVSMPQIWGIELVGKLSEWVSAKDVILELLRRHGVDGGVGSVLEYFGPGLQSLSAMDRHVIANMGTELGATSSVFPSDDEVYRYLKMQGRDQDWTKLKADAGCAYDRREHIDLSQIEPMIAMPSSPGNVERVADVTGREISQAYIGSSANPGYRDFAIAAEIVRDARVHPQVSFDINPTSRQLLLKLIRDGHLSNLIASGARLHQAGCNGCIGMGQAPATNKLSLRTVPRNFPGRSGTQDDQVCLVSPETAAASALTGCITDPRTLDVEYPKIETAENCGAPLELFVAPLPVAESDRIDLEKGPNIVSLPRLNEMPAELNATVLLKLGDDISTDEILPAGTRVLPFRSNIPRIAEFAFHAIDETYVARARETSNEEGHVVIAGANYGQGSSREHAALAPRALGLRIVIAKSFARIHWQNLINFGVLPLTFLDPADYDRVQRSDRLRITRLDQIAETASLSLENLSQNSSLMVRHQLSPRQVEVVLAGGLINSIRNAIASR